jgi:hypothetical protein
MDFHRNCSGRLPFRVRRIPAVMAVAGAGMNDAGEDFGARLRAYRRSSGLSQEELSKRSGLTVRMISKLENGRTQRPFPNSLRRLAVTRTGRAGVSSPGWLVSWVFTRSGSGRGLHPGVDVMVRGPRASGALRLAAVSGDHLGGDRQLVPGPCPRVGPAGVSGRQQGMHFEGRLAGPGMQPGQRDLVAVLCSAAWRWWAVARTPSSAAARVAV